MATELPDLSEKEFSERLGACCRRELAPDARRKMYLHYRELRRWSRRVALVGGGIAEEVVERLFGESVRALELLDDSVSSLVDVGSGAGFPGLVIAAVRPEVKVFLVEPRARKWAFLRAAADRAALSVRCVNARVAAALPAELPKRIDCATVRALRLGAVELGALAGRLSEGGSILLWSSDGLAPDGFDVVRSLDLEAGRGQVLRLEPTEVALP